VSSLFKTQDLSLRWDPLPALRCQCLIESLEAGKVIRPSNNKIVRDHLDETVREVCQAEVWPVPQGRGWDDHCDYVASLMEELANELWSGDEYTYSAARSQADRMSEECLLEWRKR